MLCFDIRVKPLLWRSLSVQLKPTWTLPAPDALLQHKMLSHTCFFFQSLLLIISLLLLIIIVHVSLDNFMYDFHNYVGR